MHSPTDNNAEEKGIEKSNVISGANETSNDESDICGGDNKETKINSENEVITVEIKPLFASKYTSL